MTPTKKESTRALKKRLLGFLQTDDFIQNLDHLRELPARQAVNPLFSFFHHREPLIRWRAVTSMGIITAFLAETEMESARVIMRRLMWTLNDESGGIGWGSPEAMGEIMARSHDLACEFGCILVSYVREEANYLEHEVLQRGVLWGLGRLGYVYPEYMRVASPALHPFLRSEDPFHRGLSAWAITPMADQTAVPRLKDLTRDDTAITLYTDLRLISTTVGRLAREALKHLSPI
ncbi:Methylated-DNA--protein-cysteine methyltransferase (EC [Olavius algarvensis associated proteobacterium Delta 3]|nr:Methylated-DNA--protein-cysteine methyltransferase (EC [Olavius algarvensis associated proteobacterium Delta 3]CAB5149455.1 Methylated-DNA--protein-cysteine methyltransferase (EC [Olavius algarvensis associated proteobacterium Delta 3]